MLHNTTTAAPSPYPDVKKWVAIVGALTGALLLLIPLLIYYLCQKPRRAIEKTPSLLTGHDLKPNTTIQETDVSYGTI